MPLCYQDISCNNMTTWPFHPLQSNKKEKLNRNDFVRTLKYILAISVCLVSIKCKGKRHVTKSSRDRWLFQNKNTPGTKHFQFYFSFSLCSFSFLLYSTNKRHNFNITFSPKSLPIQSTPQLNLRWIEHFDHFQSDFSYVNSIQLIIQIQII